MPDLERILDRVMEPLDYIKPSVDRVVEPLATFAAGNMAFVTAATVMDMSSSWAIAGGIAVNALLAVPAYALFRNASGRIAERSYGFHIESGWSYLRTATLLGCAVAATMGSGMIEDKRLVSTSPPPKLGSIGDDFTAVYGFTFPTDSDCKITSRFGMRRHPITKVKKQHNGVDIACPEGTPIYAAADGEVEAVETDAANGNWIRIRHDHGFTTTYLHLQDASVSVGQTVSSGDQIGLMGSTGRATGSHLHFTEKKDGEYLDPLRPRDEERYAGKAKEGSARQKALLDTIAWAEGGVDYNTLFGGKTFSGYETHPALQTGWTGKQVAAGRYQFVPSTFVDLQRQGYFADFSPEAQDEAALALIKQAGVTDKDITTALDDGDFTILAKKLNRAWASLPDPATGESHYAGNTARDLDDLSEKLQESYGAQRKTGIFSRVALYGERAVDGIRGLF